MPVNLLKTHIGRSSNFQSNTRRTLIGIDSSEIVTSHTHKWMQTTFEDVFPAEATTVEEYLQQCLLIILIHKDKTGGDAASDGWEVTNHCETQTLVLLGRTGYGKSATDNSIIGRKAFTSKNSSAGVTSTCELQSTQLVDGHRYPRPFFIFPGEPEVIGKEIVKCMDFAKDGIHAVILVFSVQTFKEFFGDKISDYMIVVFTGGDELEDSDEALDGYICSASLTL